MTYTVDFRAIICHQLKHQPLAGKVSSSLLASRKAMLPPLLRRFWARVSCMVSGAVIVFVAC
jgi:hypothetical protein